MRTSTDLIPDGDYKNVEQPKGYGGWGKDKGADKGFPIPFTSTYRIKAVPENVVNGSNVPTGGLPGSIGYYDLGLNSELDLICYYIKLTGFRGEYNSPAITSTHIHNAVAGTSGPPRLAFPNPEATSDPTVRIGAGCVSGPFETGVMPNGTDTGLGFTIALLESNPAAYYVDYHTDAAPQGAAAGNVRGQFA